MVSAESMKTMSACGVACTSSAFSCSDESRFSGIAILSTAIFAVLISIISILILGLVPITLLNLVSVLFIVIMNIVLGLIQKQSPYDFS